MIWGDWEGKEKIRKRERERKRWERDGREGYIEWRKSMKDQRMIFLCFDRSSRRDRNLWMIILMGNVTLLIRLLLLLLSLRQSGEKNWCKKWLSFDCRQISGLSLRIAFRLRSLKVVLHYRNIKKISAKKTMSWGPN